MATHLFLQQAAAAAHTMKQDADFDTLVKSYDFDAVVRELGQQGDFILTIFERILDHYREHHPSPQPPAAVVRNLLITYTEEVQHE